jgi:hypothetical protein
MCGVMTLRFLAATAAVFASAGCAMDVDYIDIDPDVAIFKQKNNEIWLRAKPMANSGRQYPQVTVVWSVKDPDIAEVDQTGRLRPVKSGRTEAVATLGSITASVPVEVLFASKIKVEPELMELVVEGEPKEFNVRVYDYLGRELKDRTPMFKSLDTKVLTMGSNAAHPGSTPGTAEVEVKVDEAVQRVKAIVKKK